MNQSLSTCFASPQRSSQKEIMQQYRVIADNEDLVVMMNGVASMLTVTNLNRQIVFANKSVLNTLGAIDLPQALGKRFGELFGCRHSFEVNGCGTSQHCMACGVTRTMVSCITEDTRVEDCCLTNDNANLTLDLRVQCTSIRLKGHKFILCSLTDISNEKRRGVMERIFFHDLNNTITGLNGITYTLNKAKVSEYPAYFSHLTLLVNSLTDQINSHKVLTMAENNEYQTKQNKLFTLEVVNEEVEKYKQQADMDGKKIRIIDNSKNHMFISDRILLSRVLGNMIKNALEAEPSGAKIDITVHIDNDRFLNFRVHNDCVMSENEKIKVFNRSFSTKGANRGLGTYSMKMLTEKYLNGKVDFVSNPEEGTVFIVKIPA